MADAAIMATESMRLNASGHPKDIGRACFGKEIYNLCIQESREEANRESTPNYLKQSWQARPLEEGTSRCESRNTSVPSPGKKRLRPYRAGQIDSDGRCG